MNNEAARSATSANNSECRSGLDLVLSMIVTKTFLAWEQHRGNLPAEAIKQLDIDNDWPRGVAAAVVKRLNRDVKFRNQLRKWFLPVARRR